MRYFYLLILLVCSSAGFAQSYYKGIITDKVTINATDQTVVAFVHPVSDEPATDPQKTYYWYSGNQINQTQGGFSGKLLNGPYTVFYPSKNLKEQGQFEKGLKQGEWKSWYENGQLKEITKWRSGDKSGWFREYSEGGQLQKQGHFKDGALQGKITSYAGKDSTSVITYKDGAPVLKATKKKRSGLHIKQRVKSILKNPFKKKKIQTKDNKKKRSK